jgi:hypothetical protein
VRPDARRWRHREPVHPSGFDAEVRVVPAQPDVSPTHHHQGRSAVVNDKRREIGVGDLVDIPAGADEVCTTRYRVRVAEIGTYGISGPRIRADGTPMVSRSIESKDGFVNRVVPWEVVLKSTITRAEAGESS